MCVGAIVHSRISRVVYGATEPKAGAVSGRRAGDPVALMADNQLIKHTLGWMQTEIELMTRVIWAEWLKEFDRLRASSLSMMKEIATSIAQISQQTVKTDTCKTDTHKKNTCIIIFAKYPAQNMAKTRLQPALGSNGAARMAQKLLLHSVEQAVATDYVVELCVSPVPANPCWQVLDLPRTLQWTAQAEGDLGVRLLTASQQALNQYQKIVLVGTDCPSLTAQRIQAAVHQLDQHDVVMIPASDGGYVLLGFKHADESLFSNITWSVDSVAAVTQQRIAALGWTLAILEPLHDIDDPDDLQHLPSGWLDGHAIASDTQ